LHALTSLRDSGSNVVASWNRAAAGCQHAGRFVTPSSATAAMAAQDLAGLSAINDFQVSPAATTASDADPISTYTFLVVFQRQFDTAKGATPRLAHWEA
jgi:hypothetical protein